MKTKNIFTIAAALTIGLSSCNDNEDTTAPTITVTSPTNHSHHDMGTQFVIDATFEDDTELASFHVHLGDENGAHVHELDYEVSGSITGTSYHLSDTVMIPDSLGTVYWLEFDVTDAASNNSEESIMLHFDMHGTGHSH